MKQGVLEHVFHRASPIPLWHACDGQGRAVQCKQAPTGHRAGQAEPAGALQIISRATVMEMHASLFQKETQLYTKQCEFTWACQHDIEI